MRKNRRSKKLSVSELASLLLITFSAITECDTIVSLLHESVFAYSNFHDVGINDE